LIPPAFVTEWRGQVGPALDARTGVVELIVTDTILRERHNTGRHNMTELLREAVTEAERLPESHQNVIAAIIREEMEDEARWDAAFARSHDVLSKLAAEAMEEDRAGQTQELDPETL
jgi:hypothetical protein